MTTDVPSSRNDRQGPVPRSVEELARDPAWLVTRTGHDQRWTTAEWRAEHAGVQWRIGLTPVNGTTSALIRWRDDEVVEHIRGPEPTLCARAHEWANSLTPQGIRNQV